MQIHKLNEEYLNLKPFSRLERFYKEHREKEILCTSSFGVYSSCLLLLISKVYPRQRIHFIDTGNHFLETLSYKAELTHLYELKVESISAGPEVHSLSRKHELWKVNADYCCHIKKIKPLLLLKNRHQFWVTGLQGWQTKHRSTLKVFEKSDGIVKFNPLIDMKKEECLDLMKKNNIPHHPLTKFGYESVSCIQCTSSGKARNGRWRATKKTECGLHL